MKNYILSLIGLLIFSIVYPSRAEDFECKGFDRLEENLESIDYSLLSHYYQTEYKLNDVIGDYILLKGFNLRVKEKTQLLLGNTSTKQYMTYSLTDKENKAHSLECLGLKEKAAPLIDEAIAPFDAKKLEETARAAEFSEEEIEAVTSYKVKVKIDGKQKPIHFNKLSLSFMQVMHEERLKSDICDMTPKIGNPHEWSEESKDRFKKMLVTPNLLSKLLLALGNGETSWYMKTGKEAELRSWILAQENRSVTLTEIFRQSYRLHCGDVYLSLLNIENVLSEYFRHPKRQYLTQTNKLSPIINHLGSELDHYGPWYHLFGMILFGYEEGRLMGFIAGTIETGTALFSDEITDTQENFMVRGSNTGADLFHFVKKKKYLKYISDPSKLDRHYYLNLTEDFTQRLKRLKKDLFP